MEVTAVRVRNVLTRTSGYLRGVTSHSLQPYRGCALGNSLCGVGCYVQHARHLLGGRSWGSFVDVRENAADSYLRYAPRERSWARRECGGFSIFLSSATEPFPPQERRYRITRDLLIRMLDEPPDELVVQTHSHQVSRETDLLAELGARCRLRVHISIETDLETFPGLPRHASSVARRFEAAGDLRRAGVRTVITVAPLLPIERPEEFFARCAACADAVVLDHFIGGDGTPDGRRTRATLLPAAVARLDPAALELAYRDRMATIASRHLPGRVGVGSDGFAGRLGPASGSIRPPSAP
jgi:DNA repair photolyase